MTHVCIDKLCFLESLSKKNVVLCFLKNTPEIGYHKELCSTVMFLLCFLSEPFAYATLKAIFFCSEPAEPDIRTLKLYHNNLDEVVIKALFTYVNNRCNFFN